MFGYLDRSFKILILLTSAMIFQPCYSADEGKAAPEMQAKLLDGTSFSLSETKGQVVVIHFWATWCEPCRTEMPLLESYFKKHHGEGMQLLAISMDNPKDESKVRDVMKSFSFKSAMSGNSSYKAYGRIWKLPLTFIIDRKGILRKDGWNLGRVMTSADLEQVITPLLREKP